MEGAAAPEAGTTPTQAAPEGTSEGTTAPDSFTKLDPNSLPPELRPFYDSMQGDYTRKMQEAAPYRKLGDELGLDQNGLREAAELYTALRDPQQLVSFYNELSAALQAQGLTPAQAQAAATQHVQEQLGGQQEDYSALDPEERRIAELESRLARFEQSAQADREAHEQRMQQQAYIAEINRQDSLLREQHPDWTQDDIDAVYELSSFYGGNLLDAAPRYEEIISNRVARILNGKGAAAGNPAMAPLPPAVPGVTKPQSFGDNLDAAHKAAMELVRSMPPLPRP